MKATYDVEGNVLQVLNGQAIADTASLLRGPDAAVHLGTAEGHDVVGFLVVGATAYLPFGLGYDPDSDTLTVGETTDEPELVTENGDLIGYWAVDEQEPDGFRDPIGFAIRRASEHLAPAIAALPQPLTLHKR